MQISQAMLSKITPESLSCLSASEAEELLVLLEQQRLQQARSSYQDFIKCIDVPGAPVNEDDEDCEEFYPDSVTPAPHHELIIAALQAVADGKIKRLMIFAPPGSAKSTYTTVCFPPFIMGRKKRQNIISTSYGTPLARKFGRRCRAIAKSKKFSNVFGTAISGDSSAADEWALLNESEYMAGGILSGVTGNRADGLLIDDPVKGRRDADSAAVQTSTKDAYNDDLVTRLKPNAWQIIIQTRWSELDLSGHILPKDYAGQTGWVDGQDGHKWYVVNLPFQCERSDDPLGRKPGECLWSDYYNIDEILKMKSLPSKQRTWTALYQQRPAPDEGIYFKRENVNWYDAAPKHLRYYGASDYAVTADGGDYTVHGVCGIDPDDNLYIIDWWRGQTESNIWVDQFLAMMKQHKPLIWAEEQGQIIKSLGPFIDKRMREQRIYGRREQFTSIADKATRCRSFQARMAMGKVYMPRNAPWVSDLVTEMLSFPAGRNDDQVDVLGLFGRILDDMARGVMPNGQKQKARSDYTSYSTSDDDEDSWKTA